MLTPHNTLETSRAFGQLSKPFFLDYLLATLKGGEERECGTANDLFEGETLDRLRSKVSREALATSVIFTDLLSDTTLSAFVTTSSQATPRAVLINTRLRVDPEVLAHALIEEIIHAQQTLDGVDVDAQRQAFPYEDRPYEREAKRLATEVIGYEPDDYKVIIKRPAPSGPLFDDRLPDRDSPA